MKYLLHGTFWGSVQQIIGVSSGLLLSYFFGHFTSKQVFGEYNLILSYLSLLTFVSLPGLDTALVRSAGKNYDASFPYAVKLKILCSFLGTPVLFFASLFYYIQNQVELAIALLIAAVLFPFLNGFSNYAAFLTGKKRFRQLAAINIISSLIFLVSHLISIIWFNTSMALLIAFLLSRVCSDILGYIFTRRFVLNNKRDQGLFEYGLFLTFVNILPWVSGHIGNIMLGSLAGVEILAVYMVSTRFLVAVQKNFIVFYKPVTAKIAAQSPLEHLTLLKKHGLKLIGIGLLMAIVLFLLTPFLVSFFFTQQYKDAIFFGQWASLALIPLPFSWVLSDMLIYQKKRREQIIVSITPQILKIILFFLLIPKMGITALIIILLLDRFNEAVLPLFFLLKPAYKK